MAAVMKRAIDVLVAAVGLVLPSPLLIVVVLPIKLTSPGPAVQRAYYALVLAYDPGVLLVAESGGSWQDSRPNWLIQNASIGCWLETATRLVAADAPGDPAGTAAQPVGEETAAGTLGTPFGVAPRRFI
jgi:hypothetical protein